MVVATAATAVACLGCTLMAAEALGRMATAKSASTLGRFIGVTRSAAGAEAFGSAVAAAEEMETAGTIVLCYRATIGVAAERVVGAAGITAGIIRLRRAIRRSGIRIGVVRPRSVRRS